MEKKGGFGHPKAVKSLPGCLLSACAAGVTGWVAESTGAGNASPELYPVSTGVFMKSIIIADSARQITALGRNQHIKLLHLYKVADLL